MIYEIAFLSMSIAFIYMNNADTDQVPLYMASHLGLHCLSMYTISL